ncbi:hypothetical protein AAZX31_13G314700 [Glycine max]|uniref:methyl-CpG-binding domain-containing protein 7-like isoform X1 n=1 Tax=Glycine soja TaxID=3848 RepID=UPI0010392EBC|nr:methyl-CpG-binding domain-containing protein 7-like isoform X1 [Glycine soja]XP_028187244.1 methyl-CpG-binding domain-containing protein 7-like isoform X1 [Glycine soja]XP_028187245.1 methyl-CpG-binding domain-containing protein 7-like isoform X1 [Glycine soja]XP_028187246.1 methyl-CpG-binding domain-containing protein 7-like isoform X1 [Glycine soja]XP_028187247.1 methyl-CpG-binding domain-containing protein 7-like isoform X1 [Glycine soja]XP_028187248.1 methyl-CpG-binding domain-containin
MLLASNHHHQQQQQYHGPALPMMPTPLQVRRRPVFEFDDEHLQNQKPTIPMELQIVSSQQHFRLPDGWVVEKKPRPSHESRFDKYYYEPGTGRKFRSLLSVQRHLAGETRDYVVANTMMSKNENTLFFLQNFIESGSGQKFGSLRALDNFLSEENACTTTPKSAVKSGTGEQRACGVRSGQKAVHKGSSVGEEVQITPKSLKHTIQSALSEKSDSRKKTKSEKDNRASMHNLTVPPPAKVSWVLSGSGGFWSPFLDDSIVPEPEKMKWSKAFVLSIHDDGDINGLNS